MIALRSAVARASHHAWLAVICCCLCLEVLLPAHAQPSGHAVPLWQIDGRENRIYLLGSVHMLRESDHPLPTVFYEAYDDADALIMELDVTSIDPVATQALVNELGMIKDGRQLDDLLGATDYSAALGLAERANIPLAMLAGAEPWLAAVTIDVLMLTRLGFSPAQGVEMRFAELAANDGKAISGLETERQQLEMLDGLSAPAQRDLLLQTLAEGEDVDSAMNELIASWRHGNTGEMESGLLQDIRKYPEIYQAILVRRNENWVRQIFELLDDPKDYLIVVGAMHLVGGDGLPSLLQQKGLTVRQLRQSE
jgi:uncharacterized protein YbaP (TraB family)